MNYNPIDFLGIIEEDSTDDDSIYDDMPPLIKSININKDNIDKENIDKENLENDNISELSSNDSMYDDMPALISADEEYDEDESSDDESSDDDYNYYKNGNFNCNCYGIDESDGSDGSVGSDGNDDASAYITVV